MDQYNLNNSQPATPNLHHRSFGHWVLAAIIILLVLCNIAIYAYRMYLKDVIGDLAQQNNKAGKEEPIPTGWKTYRNEEYGFEFKYPGDWREDESTSSGAYINLTTLFAGKEGYTIAGTDGMSFSISSRAIEDEKKYRENSITPDFYKFIYSPIQGKKAYISEELRGTEGFYKEMLVELDSKTLVISASPLNLKDFNQILSTFRFIEKTDDSLKTYRNEELGFEFRHPGDWQYKKCPEGGYYMEVGFYFGKGINIHCEDALHLNGEFIVAIKDWTGSLDKYIDFIKNSSNDKTIDKFILDNQTGFKVSSSIYHTPFDPSTIDPSKKRLNHIFLIKNKIYWISFYNFPEESLPIYNQILSTFKFIK